MPFIQQYAHGLMTSRVLFTSASGRFGFRADQKIKILRIHLRLYGATLTNLKGLRPKLIINRMITNGRTSPIEFLPAQTLMLLIIIMNLINFTV